MNVLLVDEEEEYVSTLAERLRLRGVSVRTASGIEQAFSEIQSWAPSIVVLDVTQQERSGMDMIRRLKADFPQIGIIAVADLGRIRDAQESLRLGAGHCLMKPFHIEELLDLLEAVAKPR